MESLNKTLKSIVANAHSTSELTMHARKMLLKEADLRIAGLLTVSERAQIRPKLAAAVMKAPIAIKVSEKLNEVQLATARDLLYQWAMQTADAAMMETENLMGSDFNEESAAAFVARIESVMLTVADR